MKKISKYILFVILLMTMFSSTVSAADIGDINLTMDVGTVGDAGGDNGLQITHIKSEGIEIEDNTSAWNKIFKQYEGIIIGVSGLATLTFVLLFIVFFIKLGGAANNPQDRNRYKSALIWTGAATAGFGGVFTFVGVSSTFFK